jgi:hypothetical protein
MAEIESQWTYQIVAVAGRQRRTVLAEMNTKQWMT